MVCVHGSTVVSVPPGFSSPCSFMAAVSGANGSILWERPIAQDGALVLCGVPQPRDSGASSACILMGRPGSLIAVDLLTGGPVLCTSPGPRMGGPALACSEKGQPVLSGGVAGWKGWF